MKKVVMAFGAFDGIHTGHLHYLRAAKRMGDYLVVSIARDNASWKFNIFYNLPENERLKLVKELGIADKVILGSMTNAFEKIEKINPDILAISPYVPVHQDIIQEDLKSKGLKAKVKNVKPYKPFLFDEYFKRPIRAKELMGLPAKK